MGKCLVYLTRPEAETSPWSDLVRWVAVAEGFRAVVYLVVRCSVLELTTEMNLAIRPVVLLTYPQTSR